MSTKAPEKVTVRNIKGETKLFIPEASSHSPDGKACVMEMVSWMAGETWTDAPACASPVIGAFCRSFWDASPDNWPGLLERLDRIAGSANPDADDSRAWLATDWLVRTFTPAWLRKAGLNDEADALVALTALTSSGLARDAQPIIDAARVKAAAGGAAAWDAARDAARAAAWDAAWDAARAAAWDAARAAAWDAARAAARAAGGAAGWDAGGAAAWDAARDAARAAAWDAAWDAARAAAWDAARAAARAAGGAAASKHKTYTAQYNAAYKAARSVLDVALAETVKELRVSAFDLLDRMLLQGTPA